MSTYVVTIKTDNAAFHKESSVLRSPGDELGRILVRLGNELRSGATMPEDERPLHDLNGNLVGAAQFTD